MVPAAGRKDRRERNAPVLAAFEAVNRSCLIAVLGIYVAVVLLMLEAVFVQL